MPEKPKRPCRKPGCANLTTSGYCDDHGGEVAVVRRRYDDSRGNATDRGYDCQWKRTRNVVMRRDKYLCLRCLSVDRITPATEVHHTIPVAMAPERMHETNLLISVCRSCHLWLEDQIRRFGIDNVAKDR